MASALLIGSSPSSTSRGSLVMGKVCHWLQSSGHQVTQIELRDLDPEALLHAHGDHPDISRACTRLAQADVVVVSTPVYKASYTGLLKSFLDLLDRHALADKAVLPLATGGTLAHLLSIDYALRPVLCALHAGRILPGCFLLGRDATDVIDEVAGSRALLRLREQVRSLTACVETQPSALAVAG